MIILVGVGVFYFRGCSKECINCDTSASLMRDYGAIIIPYDAADATAKAKMRGETIGKLSNYIDSYPKGPSTAIARTRLQGLQDEAASELWDKAGQLPRSTDADWVSYFKELKSLADMYPETVAGKRAKSALVDEEAFRKAEKERKIKEALSALTALGVDTACIQIGPKPEVVTKTMTIIKECDCPKCPPLVVERPRPAPRPKPRPAPRPVVAPEPEEDYSDAPIPNPPLSRKAPPSDNSGMEEAGYAGGSDPIVFVGTDQKVRVKFGDEFVNRSGRKVKYNPKLPTYIAKDSNGWLMQGRPTERDKVVQYKGFFVSMAEMPDIVGERFNLIQVNAQGEVFFLNINFDWGSVSQNVHKNDDNSLCFLIKKQD